MTIYRTMKKANRQAKRRCKTIAMKREQSRLAWERMIESLDRNYMNRNSIGREEA